MRAGEKWRAPWRELVGLETSREQDRMPPVAAELALQLARADRGHGAKRAQAQEVQALELLRVEWKLARRKRGEEGPCLVDLHDAARPRACSCKPGGERTGGKTEARFATGGSAQPPSSLADRFAGADD